MADLFKDVLASILKTKKHVLDNEDDYVPRVINKALANYYDCVMYANQMNMNPDLDNRLQYDFYLNTVRAYKRPFIDWTKKSKDENIPCVMEYFVCSYEKAKEIIAILDDAQINEIKERIRKGGLTNDKPE